jgi:opacity protein-like surface antigen
MTRLLLLTTLCASLAWAQDAVVTPGPDLRDLMHARNLAMGGAYESLGYGAESIGGNPAALSIYKRYSIEASGLWDPARAYGMGSLALADSTNGLAAGASYHFVTFGEAERRWAHLATLALALPIGDVVHLGVAGRYQSISGATQANSITMNAGVVVHPVSFLSLGLSGHNLIDVRNADITRYFVASISALIAGQFTPVFDLRADFNQTKARFAYEAGLEWVAAMSFPLRLGYQYDGIAGHQYLSGGLGYFSDGSGVDVSYRHELGGAGGRMLALTLKMQL